LGGGAGGRGIGSQVPGPSSHMIVFTVFIHGLDHTHCGDSQPTSPHIKGIALLEGTGFSEKMGALLTGLSGKTAELFSLYIAPLFWEKDVEKKTYPVEERGEDHGRIVLVQGRESFILKDRQVRKCWSQHNWPIQISEVVRILLISSKPEQARSTTQLS